MHRQPCVMVCLMLKNGDTSPLLTARQVAKMLGFSVDWVWRKAKAGELPSVRIGTSVRFIEDEIHECLKKKTQQKEEEN